jgi:hypothetical protein
VAEVKSRSRFWTTTLLVLVALAALGSLLRKRHEVSRFQSFPRVTLWAWERPEDLRSLDTRLTAVAYLDRTIFITDRASVSPRMQRLLVGPSAKIIAVVRIEAPVSSAWLNAPNLVPTVAELVVASARRPQVAALQVDFDAGRSQRDFYRALLSEIRKRMPEAMPLSMTALLSWCGRDDWIKNLPVDEAVPMYFRLGGYERSPQEPGWSYPIREPLCATSAGISTDEPWPKTRKDQRLYVFHPKSWNEVTLQNVKAWTKQ